MYRTGWWTVGRKEEHSEYAEPFTFFGIKEYWKKGTGVQVGGGDKLVNVAV